MGALSERYAIQYWHVDIADKKFERNRRRLHLFESFVSVLRYENAVPLALKRALHQITRRRIIVRKKYTRHHSSSN